MANPLTTSEAARGLAIIAGAEILGWQDPELSLSAVGWGRYLIETTHTADTALMLDPDDASSFRSTVTRAGTWRIK